MNETIRLLHSHHSDRSFTDQPVDDEVLDAIITAAHRAPTAINGQPVSLVVVRDAARRARLAELCGGQPWVARAPVFIAVVLDFHKTAVAIELAGSNQVIHESVEGMFAGLTDTGIALGTLIAAARACGLGVVPIGGLRRSPQQVIELLGLPRNSFGVAGLCIGHVDRPAVQKPRLPISTFRHDERYNEEGLQQAIRGYDLTLTDYWRSIGRSDGQPWSANTAGMYSRVYFPEVRPTAIAQGLNFSR